MEIEQLRQPIRCKPCIHAQSMGRASYSSAEARLTQFLQACTLRALSGLLGSSCKTRHHLRHPVEHTLEPQTLQANPRPLKRALRHVCLSPMSKIRRSESRLLQTTCHISAIREFQGVHLVLRNFFDFDKIRHGFSSCEIAVASAISRLQLPVLPKDSS